MVSFRRLLDKKQVISRHQVQSLSDALSHHLADVITVNQTCSLIFNEISHFSTLHQTGAPIVRSHGLSWSLRSRCTRSGAFGSGLLTGSRGVGTRGSQCRRVACACVARARIRSRAYFMSILSGFVSHGKNVGLAWIVLTFHAGNNPVSRSNYVSAL
jgi:hypothetical protein